MSHFPGSDPDVLAALGRELNGMCGDDAAAEQLRKKLVEDYETWPGIFEVWRLAGKQKQDRERAALLRDAEATRAAHEAECPGFCVEINEQRKTVSVELCNKVFVAVPWSYEFQERELICRRGADIDREKLLSEELAKRGAGWIDAREYELRQLESHGKLVWPGYTKRTNGGIRT